MYVIFWFPLVLSVIGTVFYFLFAEAGLLWKLIMAALTAAALVLMLVSDLRSEVHFLVPLGIQIVVSFWFPLYFQLE